MRFRNTIADGLNFCVGMRNSTVYNCTARNTGDDAFAAWPATFGTAAFPPGLNVFKNNTAEVPWLAHGTSIYGGESNRVEDCVFKDIGQGAGILISTTFPAVGFSGTTVVQRNDIIGSGGDDNTYSWRGALQIMADRQGISGLNINNLNIIDAISDGVKFQSAGASQISNVTVDHVTIENPGKRGTGSGIMENPGVRGSASLSYVSVSNPASYEWADESGDFTIRVGPGNRGWTSNTAIGKNMTASSFAGSGPSDANDNDQSTVWESANNQFPQWLQVDLGEEILIHRVILLLPSAWDSRTQTITVQGGAGESVLTDLAGPEDYTFDPAGGNRVEINFPEETVRYVRLTITANTGKPAAQIAEFQVIDTVIQTHTRPRYVTARPQTLWSGDPRHVVRHAQTLQSAVLYDCRGRAVMDLRSVSPHAFDRLLKGMYVIRLV